MSRYLVKNWSQKHRYTHLHVYEISFEDFHSCITDHVASIVVGAECPDSVNAYSAIDGKVYMEPLCDDRFCALVSGQSELADRDSVHLDDVLDKHLLLTHAYPNPQDKPIGSIIHKFKLFTVLNNIEIAKKVLAEEPDKLMICPSFALVHDDLVASGQLKILQIDGFRTELSIFLMCDISSKLSIQETLLMQEIRNFFSEFKQ